MEVSLCKVFRDLSKSSNQITNAGFIASYLDCLQDHSSGFQLASCRVVDEVAKFQWFVHNQRESKETNICLTYSDLNPNTYCLALFSFST